MVRDIELMRKILFYVEEKYRPGSMWLMDIEIAGYNGYVVLEHLELLHQCGFISNLKTNRTLDGGYFLQVGNLTNNGYDFLDYIRAEETWTQTKEIADKEKAPKTPHILFRIAKGLAEIGGTFLGAYSKTKNGD